MTIFRPVQEIDANWLTPGLCSRLARLLGLLVLLAGVPALAAAYKWVDDEGEIHFSDQPRAPRAVPVEVRPTLPATPSSADRNLPALPSNDPDGQLLQAVRVIDELAIGRALHQGANVNGRHGKQIPLFVAILQLLIAHGASLQARNGKGEQVIDIARSRAWIQLYPLLQP